MDIQSIIKTTTIGHSQHGKSSIAGYLYRGLANKLLDEKGFLKCNSLIESNVNKCMRQNNYGPHLRYALVFDGLRGDIYKGAGSPYKTITTKPYTLNIQTNEEIIQLTDLPGHQTFIRKVCGALEVSDIGIFVIDCNATFDAIVMDEEYTELIEKVVLKNDPKGSKNKGIVPKGYKMMLESRKEEIRRKKRTRAHEVDNKSKDKKIRDRMKPPILSGIFQYFCLAWHLGIRDFIFAIHKMDLVHYDEEVYKLIVDYLKYLQDTVCSQSIKSKIRCEYIPTEIIFSSSFETDSDSNIINRNITDMEWYKGGTLLETFIEMKSKNIRNRDNSKDEPFLFQINNHKVINKPKKVQTNADRSEREKKKDRTGYYRPTIQGYLFSGRFTLGEKIYLPIKGEEKEFTGPIRSIAPQKKKGTKTISEFIPGRHYKIYLNDKDLKEMHDKYDLEKKIFYAGNYAIQDKDNPPIIFSNKIEIEFSFIGGWLYQNDFSANIVYGYNRMFARFSFEEICRESQIGNIVIAKLKNKIAFRPLQKDDTYGKVVIEKNTFIIGVGSVVDVY